jgi:hypothetical protein
LVSYGTTSDNTSVPTSVFYGVSLALGGSEIIGTAIPIGCTTNMTSATTIVSVVGSSAPLTMIGSTGTAVYNPKGYGNQTVTNPPSGPVVSFITISGL